MSFPLISHRASYKLTIPGPDRTLSTATRPNFFCNKVKISISKELVGARSEWPPCVETGIQPPDDLIKPQTPNPVPGPMTNLNLSG